MECSNCREVLESGCSVSAGLRQEDRLILDWEKRHKGRSCSGAPRPFGKLKKKKKKSSGRLLIHISLVLETRNHLVKKKKMLSYVCIVSDRGGFASFCSANDEILDNGNFLLLLFDIQQPLMLINGNNNERKMLANCIPRHHPHHPLPPSLPFPSPSRQCLCGDVVPGASSLRYVVVPPLSP